MPLSILIFGFLDLAWSSVICDFKTRSYYNRQRPQTTTNEQKRSQTISKQPQTITIHQRTTTSTIKRPRTTRKQLQTTFSEFRLFNFFRKLEMRRSLTDVNKHPLQNLICIPTPLMTYWFITFLINLELLSVSLEALFVYNSLDFSNSARNRNYWRLTEIYLYTSDLRSCVS